MDFYITSHKIQQHVTAAKQILIATHQKPDPDAIGSLAAINFWLDSLSIPRTLFCLDNPDKNLSWLLDYQEVETSPDKILEKDFDCVIVLDSGDLRHPGLVDLIPRFAYKPGIIINIDHHHTNVLYGTTNLVDSEAVSTTEVIYKMFQHIGVSVNAKMANAILAGIIGDTSSFTNQNTSQKSLHVVSELLQCGASLNKVRDSILKNKTVGTLQAWGDILQKLQYNSRYGIATTVVVPEHMPDVNNEIEQAEGIATFLNNLGDVAAAMLLYQETENTIKGSLRTNRDNIDVSQLAKMFGGGGHKKAAGFRINGKLVQENGKWRVV